MGQGEQKHMLFLLRSNNQGFPPPPTWPLTIWEELFQTGFLANLSQTGAHKGRTLRCWNPPRLSALNLPCSLYLLPLLPHQVNPNELKWPLAIAFSEFGFLWGLSSWFELPTWNERYNPFWSQHPSGSCTMLPAHLGDSVLQPSGVGSSLGTLTFSSSNTGGAFLIWMSTIWNFDRILKTFLILKHFKFQIRIVPLMIKSIQIFQSVKSQYLK